MKTFDPPLYISLPVMGEDQLRAIHAVLSSPVIVALVLGAVDGIGPALDNQPSAAPAKPSAPEKVAGPAAAAPTAAAPGAAVEQSGSAAEPAADANDTGEIDANGHPWNPELYAGTKTKTKEGLWRLKVGAARPDPLPGFPKTDAAGDATNPATSAGSTSTTNDGAGSTQSADAASASAGTAVEEDDEFAAFKAADQATQAAPVAIPPRTWTDADLSKLCNQAAQKLGNPEPVRELIAAHILEGQVAHSRNIPDDQREAFAKAVEAKAEIEFVG